MRHATLRSSVQSAGRDQLGDTAPWSEPLSAPLRPEHANLLHAQGLRLEGEEGNCLQDLTEGTAPLDRRLVEDTEHLEGGLQQA